MASECSQTARGSVNPNDRTPLRAGRTTSRAAFTPDGKTFVLHHRGRREIAVYERRGTAPASAAPAPAPRRLVPDRAPPVAALPPLRPPSPFVPPRLGLPEAPGLKAQCTATPDVGRAANQLPQAPIFSKDGKTVLLSGGDAGVVLTFDAKSGRPGPVSDLHKGAGGALVVIPFGDDRAVSGGFDGKRATWHTRTGKRVDDVKFPELPPTPLGGRGHAGVTYAVWPGGRYTVAARKEALRPAIPGPLRILDTTTDNEAVSAVWNGGRVAFTADESRVPVLDGLRKATWYKLPSGVADDEWLTGEGVQAESGRMRS